MENERYRIIVKTASQGIWTIDDQNLTTLANRALAEMLGYEPQEMLGKSVFDFIAPRSSRRRSAVSDFVERASMSSLSFRFAPRTATRSGR